MSRARRVGPLALLLAVFPASQLAAQSADAADAAGALDRLEARVESGDTDGVADAIERWLAGARNPPRDEIGRARYLRARLMSDADAARDELLALALDGGSDWAARAWLRLGQLELAAGDPVRAEAALERLRADAPRSAAARSSWYWTARSFEDRGMLERACEGWARALTEAQNTGDARSARLAVTASAGCAPDAPRFEAQVAAFSAAEAANDMRSQLEADGFPARVVETDGLHRVRVGLFSTAEAARGVERRLRLAGFSVSVVPAVP